MTHIYNHHYVTKLRNRATARVKNMKKESRNYKLIEGEKRT